MWTEEKKNKVYNYATWTKFVKFFFFRFVSYAEFTFILTMYKKLFSLPLDCVYILLFLFMSYLTFDVKALVQIILFCIVIQLEYTQKYFSWILHVLPLNSLPLSFVHFSSIKLSLMKVESGFSFPYFFLFNSFFIYFFILNARKNFFVMHIQPQTVKYYL